jgi:hypothetical protein
VDLDGPELAARGAAQERIDVLQRAPERQGTVGVAAGRDEGGAGGPDEAVVEGGPEALEVAADEEVEGVGPALDGVGDPMGADLGGMAEGPRGQRRQAGDVVALDREAAAGTREQQVQELAEEGGTVGGAEGAVVEPGVVPEDGGTAELEGAERGQDAPAEGGGERGV